MANKPGAAEKEVVIQAALKAVRTIQISRGLQEQALYDVLSTVWDTALLMVPE